MDKMYTGYLPACKIVLKFSSWQLCSTTREHGLCCHSPFAVSLLPLSFLKIVVQLTSNFYYFHLSLLSVGVIRIHPSIYLSTFLWELWSSEFVSEWPTKLFLCLPRTSLTCISKVSLIPPKVNSKSFWTTLWDSPSELITGTIVFYTPSCPWDSVWGSYPKMERSVLAESCRAFNREVFWLHNFWALGKANQYVREGVVEATARLMAVKKQKLKRALGTR